MTETKTTFQTVAAELGDSFESFTRDNAPDDRCYRLKEDAPEWLQGSEVMIAVHKALDDRLPDDWVYEQAAMIADWLVNCDYESADDARENIGEEADSLVDVYDAARTTWLASHLNNAFLVDDACEELGAGDKDTFTRIGYGQYHAIELIANAVIEQVSDEAESRDEA